MDLESAKTAFTELLGNVQPNALAPFLKWIKDSDQFDVKEAAEVTLQSIAGDIRELVPFEAVLPSEKTYIPVAGMVRLQTEV